MKQLLLSTLALLLSITAFGQKEGTIQYTRVTQLNFEAPEGMEDMFKNMPKENSSEKTLLFTPQKSIYKNADDKIGSEDNVINMGDDDMQIQIDMQEPDEKYYLSLEENKFIHQQDFMGKQFLVTGDLKKFDWKLGKAKKKIADYICMEATTMVEDTVAVTAWFTPQIPVSIGPNGYGGLPGMILQIDRGEGNQVITATAVEMDTPDMSLIEEPKKGKKVSADQYKKIVEERMAEMRAQSSGRSGATFIEIRQ